MFKYSIFQIQEKFRERFKIIIFRDMLIQNFLNDKQSQAILNENVNLLVLDAILHGNFLIPFGGLVLLSIRIEEIRVRFQAGPYPNMLVVKELDLKSRKWAKWKPLPRIVIPGSPEWELLTEQPRDVVVLGFWFETSGFDQLGLMNGPAFSLYSQLFL